MRGGGRRWRGSGHGEGAALQEDGWARKRRWRSEEEKDEGEGEGRDEGGWSGTSKRERSTVGRGRREIKEDERRRWKGRIREMKRE